MTSAVETIASLDSERVGLLLYRLLKATHAMVFSATADSTGSLVELDVIDHERGFAGQLLAGIHPEDQAPRLQSWREAVLAKRELVQTSFRCQDTQGTWHWLREEAHLVAVGAQWNAVGILTVLSVAEPELKLVTEDTPPPAPRARGRRLGVRRPTNLTDLATDLPIAIENGELALSYQYQVAPKTRTLVGVEAFVRWKHPIHGLLFPSQFLPIAEETGAIEALGKWVFTAACRQAKQWESAGIPLRISVNLSTQQLFLPTLIQQLADGLLETGARPSLLGVEITETALLLPEAEIQTLLGALKQLGVQVQITDLGTGASSLLSLRSYPFDVLKIDQVFIQKLPDSPQDAAIVKSVIEMGHGLGMQIAAEGVENSAQVAWLQEAQCDILQGFYYSRPVSPEALEEVLCAGSYILSDTAKAA